MNTKYKKAKKMKLSKITSNAGITAEWVNLDKEKCENLLSKVPDIQRSIKHGNVNKIMRDVVYGNWKDTGMPIVISNEDKLIDGQHRLHAFLKAKFYPQVLIIKNVDHLSGYKAIDVGQTRSFADVFKSHKVHDYSLVATITSRFIRLLNKTLNQKMATYSAQDLLNCYNTYQSLIVYWKGKHSILNSLCSQSLRSAVNCYAEGHVSREDLNEFWDQVASGIGSGGARSLRDTLQKNANKNRNRYTSDELANLMLLAITRHQSGSKQTRLVLPAKTPYFN